MELKIGREWKSRRLCIVKDGQEQFVGLPGSVPEDVSREHLSLSSMGNGRWKLKNLNENNVTYVNSIAVESKEVTESDKVELGRSHYLLTWDCLRGQKVETVNIRPLKRIWKEYDEQRFDAQIAERKFNAARSATGIITMMAMVCGFFLGHDYFYIMIYAVAIGISVVFTYLAYMKSSDIPKQQREMNKHFQQHYVCPKCGHFMGFTDYDVLIQNDACPHCKAKYIK